MGKQSFYVGTDVSEIAFDESIFSNINWVQVRSDKSGIVFDDLHFENVA